MRALFGRWDERLSSHMQPAATLSQLSQRTRARCVICAVQQPHITAAPSGVKQRGEPCKATRVIDVPCDEYDALVVHAEMRRHGHVLSAKPPTPSDQISALSRGAIVSANWPSVTGDPLRRTSPTDVGTSAVKRQSSEVRTRSRKKDPRHTHTHIHNIRNHRYPWCSAQRSDLSVYRLS